MTKSERNINSGNERYESKAIRNSREGLNISIVHILITVLLMKADVPGNIDNDDHW